MNSGDKVVCIFVDGNYYAVPVSAPAAGDAVITVPLQHGQVAVPVSAPSAGDKVVLLPTDMGQYIAMGIPSPVDWRDWVSSDGRSRITNVTETHTQTNGTTGVLCEVVYEADSAYYAEGRLYYWIDCTNPDTYPIAQSPPRDWKDDPTTYTLLELDLEITVPLDTCSTVIGTTYTPKIYIDGHYVTDHGNMYSQLVGTGPHTFTFYVEDWGNFYDSVFLRYGIDGVPYAPSQYLKTYARSHGSIVTPQIHLYLLREISSSLTAGPWDLQFDVQISDVRTQSKYSQFNHDSIYS